VDKERNKLFAVSNYGEWDRNKNFIPPLLSTEEEVISLLQNLKKEKSVSK